MSNIDQLQEVYETAENSAGSAEQEQANYAKSIQYSMEVLTASAQEWANTLLDSGIVKWFVDLANSIVNISTQFGSLQTVFTAIGIFAAVKLKKPMDEYLTSLYAQIEAEKLDAATKVEETVAEDGKIISIESAKVALDSETASTVTEGASATVSSAENAGYTMSFELLSAAATQAGVAIKDFLLTNPVGWAILAVGAIASLAGVYDLLTTSMDEASDALSDFQSSYDEMDNTLSSHKDLISEAEESYANLAQGVNTLNNANINLSTEDYETFINLNNELAEAFPSLKSGIDDEGNAILNLGDDASEVYDKLEELIQREEEANSRTVRNNWDDYFENTYAEVYDAAGGKDYQSLIDANNEIIDSCQNAINALSDFNDETNDIDFNNNEGLKDFAVNFSNAYVDAVNSLNIGDSELRDNLLQSVNLNLDYGHLTIDKDAIENDLKKVGAQIDFSDLVDIASGSIEQSMNDAIAENQSYQDSIDQLMTDFKDQLKQGILTDTVYLESVAKNSVASDIVTSFIDNLSSEALEEINDKYGKNTDAFIDAEILSISDELADMKNEVGIDFMDLFSDDLSSDELMNLISQIQAYCDEHHITINWDLLTVDDDANNVSSQFQALWDTDGDGEVGINEQKNYNALKEFGILDESMAVQKEFLEITSSADTIDEKILLWNKHLETTEEKATSIANKTKSEMIDSLTDMSDGFDILDEIYADVKDGDVFDFTNLDSDKLDDFKGLDSYEDFIEAVSSSPNDISKCQSAFNELINDWIDAEDILDDVTEDTEAVTVAMLKNYGVSNAQAIVNAKLNASDIAEAVSLKDVTEETKDATAAKLQNYGISNAQEIVSSQLEAKNIAEAASLEDLANAEYDDLTATDASGQTKYQKIAALAEEQGASQLTTNALAQLVAEETIFNNSNLSVKSKISALQSLAKSFGIVLDSIKSTQIAMDQYNGMIEQYRRYEGLSEEEAEEKAKANINTLLEDDFQNAIDEKFSELITVTPTYTGGDESNKTSSTSYDNPKDYDWIEILIDRIQRKVDNLSQTVSATYKTWSTRNSALSSELSEINNEISAEQAAYNKYMALANSVNLDQSYKDLIMNGGYDTFRTTDDELADNLDLFKDYYEKALEAQDAIQDLQDSVAELAQTRFDNIATQYEEQISEIEHQVDMLEEDIDMAESRGHFASEIYYQSLISLTSTKISDLKNEYNDLYALLNNGSIQSGTEQWYQQKSAINDVETEIQEATAALVDYQNELRQLDWDVFDKQIDYISNLTDETEWYIDSFTRMNDLYDDETGKITEYGQAVQGLHALNYNAYMEQAQMYAEEIAEVQDELANDPYNSTIMEHYQELLSAQREMISNAEEEKVAIKDLISDGYDALLDVINDLIDTRKDELQSEKDLFDYQKSVNEQTATIASYQKQLAAYQGDTSEETQATIQKLKDSLKDAQEELQETEYEQWISDQEKLMDDLVEDLQDWIDARLDNIDGLVQEVITDTNNNASTINQTIQDKADSVGLTVSTALSDVWAKGGTAVTYFDGIANSLTGKDGVLTTTKKVIDNIASYVLELKNASTSKSTSSSSSSGSTYVSTAASSSSSGSSSSGSSSSGGGDNNPQVGDIVTLRGTYYYDSYGTTPSGSKGRNQQNCAQIDKVVTNHRSNQLKYIHIKGAGAYAGYTDLGWVGIEDIDGYATGSSNITKSQLAWTQENGGEVIYRASDGAVLTPLGNGDKVFTSEMSDRLWELAQSTSPLSNSLSASAVESSGSSLNTNVTNNNSMSFTLPNVKNYEEFVSAMQSDKRLEKIIQQMTIGSALGQNSLSKYKY